MTLTKAQAKDIKVPDTNVKVPNDPTDAEQLKACIRSLINELDDVKTQLARHDKLISLIP